MGVPDEWPSTEGLRQRGQNPAYRPSGTLKPVIFILNKRYEYYRFYFDKQNNQPDRAVTIVMFSTTSEPKPALYQGPRPIPAKPPDIRQISSLKEH
jgi:hypothetical protein